jgi:hypothetical protein
MWPWEGWGVWRGARGWEPEVCDRSLYPFRTDDAEVAEFWPVILHCEMLKF